MTSQVVLKDHDPQMAAGIGRCYRINAHTEATYNVLIEQVH